MIVCICKRVSESQVKREIHDGACTLADLGERLGVGTQCGCCRETACRILEEHAEPLYFRGIQASLAA